MTTATPAGNGPDNAAPAGTSVRFVLAERAKYEALCISRPHLYAIRQHQAVLPGYQIYIIEQWALDRMRFGYSVAVFTGDDMHKITVCIGRTQRREDYQQLALTAADEATLRIKETSAGLFACATNVNRLNATLNLLPVPDGDIDTAMGRFALNVNLRRFGGGGRGTLSLKMPSEAVEDSFETLFHIADNVSVYYAVWEMGRLVQIALYLLGYLTDCYADGLVCDHTLAAARRFSVEYSLPESEGGEGTLQPSNVALLLSKVVSARTKLYMLGYHVGKDPFDDPDAFLAGVKAFQKSVHGVATGRLDRSTCRLMDSAFLQRGAQTLKVHRMLKSKLDEKKGHAQAMEQETPDMERFASTVHGSDRLKYLLRGKGRPYALPESIPSDDIDTGRLELHLHRMFHAVTSKQAPFKKPDLLRPGRRLGIKIPGSRTHTSHPTGQTTPLLPASDIGHNFFKLSRAQTNESKGKSSEYSGYIDPQHAHMPPIQPSSLRPSRMSRAFRSSDCLIGLYSESSAEERAHQLRRSRSASMLHQPHLQPAIEQLRLDFRVYACFEEYLDYEAQLLSNIAQLQLVASDMDQRIAEADVRIAERETHLAGMHDTVQQALQRHQSLNDQVKASMVDGSKLQYELGVLEERLREVDDFMADFQRKASALEAQLPAVVDKKPNQSNSSAN